MIVVPVKVDAAGITATSDSSICTCGCGQALKDVSWQPWDPNTTESIINGHYYLDGEYTQKKQYTVNSGVRMVLDLRGYKLTTKDSRLFLVYGYAAVIDTVGGGRISANASSANNGGAVLIAWDAVAMNDEQDATFALYNCTATLEKGKSAKNGGLFALGNDCTLKIYNSTLLNASAAERGGAINDLFAIPAREGIGRAKTVPADEYKAAYAKLVEDMEDQINAIAEKGGDAF